MSKPPISETAVLMAATHLLVELYGHDEDVTDSLFRTRIQDAAFKDCAEKAWRLARAVELANPERDAASAPRVPLRVISRKAE